MIIKIKTSSYVVSHNFTATQNLRRALEMKKAFDFIVCASYSL